MSHGYRYAILSYKLKDPIEGKLNQIIKIIGRWGGTYSPNCRCDVRWYPKFMTEIRNWVNANASNDLVIVQDVNSTRFSNDALALVKWYSAESAIIDLERLIESNDPILQNEIQAEMLADQERERLRLLQNELNARALEVLRANDQAGGTLIDFDVFDPRIDISDLIKNVDASDFLEANDLVGDDSFEPLSGFGILNIDGISQSPQTNNNKALLALIGLAVLS